MSVCRCLCFLTLMLIMNVCFIYVELNETLLYVHVYNTLYFILSTENQRDDVCSTNQVMLRHESIVIISLVRDENNLKDDMTATEASSNQRRGQTSETDSTKLD